MDDVFLQKSITPMLIGTSKPFDSDEYIFELKFDGARCLAYLDESGTHLRNKRNKDVTALYPELSALHTHADARCILDGELVCVVDGKPNFNGYQRRSLLNDSRKIRVAAQKFPIAFAAFDILYLKDKPLFDADLLKRKRLLAENIREGDGLSVARYIFEKGVLLFDAVKEQQLEGIVAKKIGTPYYPSRRSDIWLKIKAQLEEDLLICGFTLTDGGVLKDYALARDCGGELQFDGFVYSGGGQRKTQSMLALYEKNKMPPLCDVGRNVFWIKPTLTAVVSCMYKTLSGGRRQAYVKDIVAR